MAEQHDLATPETTPAKTKSSLVIEALTLDRTVPAAAATPAADGSTPEPGMVRIRLRDNLGQPLECSYSGAEAQELIRYINTANFTQVSLQKRLLQKLTSDQLIPPGSVSGTPDPPHGGGPPA